MSEIKQLVSKAEAAMRARDFSKALEIWAEIRNIYSDNLKAYSQAAKAAMEISNFAQAQSLCKMGIAKAPKSIDLWNIYGDVALRQKDYPEAIRRFFIVRLNFPNHHRGYSQAASICIAQNDLEQAEALYMEGMQNAPLFIEPWVGYAEIAMRKGDFVKALKRWATVRKEFPQKHPGYSRAVAVCLELRDFVQAENLCRQAMKKIPERPEPWRDYAEVAMRRRDFPEALKRWAVVREKFPQQPAGYSRAAAACMEMLDYDQAETLCKEGMEQIPERPEPWRDYAEIAMRRRDFPEALKRWTVVREKFPQQPAGYSRATAACMEMLDFEQAEILCKEGMKQIPERPEPWRDYAEVAMRRRDFPEALKRWAVVREKFPQQPAGYSRATAACIEMLDFEQAETLCKESMKQIPERIEPWRDYAEIAMRQYEFTEALKRWGMVRKRFPDQYIGYSRAAQAYMNLHDYSEAENLCLEGMKRIPHEEHCWFIHAEIPRARHDPDETLRRWNVIRNKFPLNVTAYSRPAIIYMEINDFEKAEIICSEGMKKLPKFVELWRDYAEVCMRRKDIPEALKRWRNVREKFPQYSGGYSKPINVYLETEDFRQAEILCDEFHDKMPYAVEPLILRAEIHRRKKEFEQAMACWLEVKSKYPWLESGYSGAANVCKETGNLNSAIAYCQEGIKKTYGFEEVFTYQLAKLYLGYNNKYDKIKGINLLTDLTNKYKFILKKPIFYEILYHIFYINFEFITNNKQLTFYILESLLHEPMGNRPLNIFIMGYLFYRYRKPEKYIRDFLSNQNIDSDVAKLLSHNTNISDKEKIMFKIMEKEPSTYVLIGIYYWTRDYKLFINFIDYVIKNKLWKNLDCISFYNFINIAMLVWHEEYEFLIDKYLLLNNETSTAKNTLILRKNNIYNLKLTNRLYIPKKRLKIALCVSGQLRGYKSTFESWKKTLKLYEHDVHIFVHTWKNISKNRRLHLDRLFNGKFLQEITNISLVKTIYYIKNNYSNLWNYIDANEIVTYQDLSIFYNTLDVVIEDENDYKFSNFTNIEKMYYKIYSANLMLSQPKRNFDLVIRMRPDLYLKSNEDIDLYNIHKRSIKDNIVFITNGLLVLPSYLTGVPHDIFAIGSQRIMDIYSNTYFDYYKYLSMPLYNRPIRLQPHVNLAYQLFIHGITCENIPFQEKFIDRETLSTADIYQLLQKDISGKKLTQEDQRLLRACEEDMAAEKKNIEGIY